MEVKKKKENKRIFYDKFKLYLLHGSNKILKNSKRAAQCVSINNFIVRK